MNASFPLHQQKWKLSSRQTQIDNIERYCVRFLQDKPLVKIERFGLQMQANRLAEKFSQSVVNKFVTWTRAILEEAVDEDLLAKNPAKKLQMPETRPENKRFLTLDEIPVVLEKLPFREQLIMRMSVVLGLRQANCSRFDGMMSTGILFVWTKQQWTALSTPR